MNQRRGGTPTKVDSSGHGGASSIPWYELLAFAGWCVLVGYLTLMPGDGLSQGMSSSCVLCGDFGGADLVRNILMFMPAGVFLMRRGTSPVLAIGIGFCISAGIECAQLLVPGRHASLRDVLINGLGAGVGALLYFAMLAGVRGRSRFALGAALLFPLVMVASTGWLSKSVGTDGIYFAQWVPERPYYAPWDGALLHATIDGARTPIGVMRDTGPRRAALERGAPVQLVIRRGTPTTDLTAFYVVMDHQQREILMIGAQGDNLVVRHRLRSALVRLDLPDVRFESFLTANPTEMVTLQVTRDAAGHVCVSGPRRSECAPLPALGSGWGLVLWKGALRSSLRRFLDGVSLWLLLVPAALAFSVAQRSRAPLWFALLFGAVAATGRMSGLAWLGGIELAAVALALGAGYWLSVRLQPVTVPEQ